MGLTEQWCPRCNMEQMEQMVHKAQPVHKVHRVLEQMEQMVHRCIMTLTLVWFIIPNLLHSPQHMV